uniref:Si:ch211-93n23.7 n=1 Tax=Seriola lalandi dorsalis TaxID=1841481 RepID=A0A3B4WE76_SERLL
MTHVGDASTRCCHSNVIITETLSVLWLVSCSYLQSEDKVDLCGRGSWWLGTLKDTPVPGLYHIRDFIEEADLNPVRKTYGFKGVGRKAQTLGVRNGDLLLPGAYDYTDSTQEVLMHQASYSFKNCPWPDIVTLGIRDKHINTSPCDYNVTPKPVEKIPSEQTTHESCLDPLFFSSLTVLLSSSSFLFLSFFFFFFLTAIPPPLLSSLLSLQACDLSVDCATDQLSACKYLVTKTCY